MASPSRIARALLIALTYAVAAPASGQDDRPLRVGIVTFVSGLGAGVMGVPARNAAELTLDALNAGAVPPPHATRGFGGMPVEMVLLDEAGSTSSVVTQFRNLVQGRGVEIVVGYISSANCLAVAPVADELRTLTVIFNCGTPRLFEDTSYKYVFRTAAHSAVDSVAAARYVR